MIQNLTPKNANIFHCNLCNFNCSKNSDWNRHIMTKKHLKITNCENLMQKNTDSEFICNCGKKYKYSSGLSRHKNNCKSSQTVINFSSNKLEKENIIINLLNQNKELQELLLELLSKEK